MIFKLAIGSYTIRVEVMEQYSKYTVNGERFAGLNFCGFNPTEVFTEILSRFLSQKCLLLMSSTYIHGKTFAVLLIAAKTVKV